MASGSFRNLGLSLSPTHRTPVPKASSSKSKDLRKDLPPASVPRVRNKLPQTFFDALKEKRQAGSPHRFTNSDVRAIVDFISTPPERIHRPVLSEERLRRDREALDKAYEQFRREKADLERERAALPQKPPLLERLSAVASANARKAAATLSAPKPILIDFNKKTNEDLAKLLGPRFEAVQRRLQPLFNCEKRYKLAPDLKQGFERVVHLVDDLYQALELRLEGWSLQDKKVLERCFLLLKGYSFTPLRPQYEKHVRFVVEEFAHFVFPDGDDVWATLDHETTDTRLFTCLEQPCPYRHNNPEHPDIDSVQRLFLSTNVTLQRILLQGHPIRVQSPEPAEPTPSQTPRLVGVGPEFTRFLEILRSLPQTPRTVSPPPLAPDLPPVSPVMAAALTPDQLLRALATLTDTVNNLTTNPPLQLPRPHPLVEKVL
ncbi:hypothetical protein BDW22DRAFT_1427552 [Trametopsis cervina]|nr:hypothetical protein BDW22DRAFT_1427552 [Trametopsis cervina]